MTTFRTHTRGYKLKLWYPGRKRKFKMLAVQLRLIRFTYRLTPSSYISRQRQKYTWTFIVCDTSPHWSDLASDLGGSPTKLSLSTKLRHASHWFFFMLQRQWSVLMSDEQRMWMSEWMNEWISQSINQTINQSINALKGLNQRTIQI